VRWKERNRPVDLLKLILAAMKLLTWNCCGSFASKVKLIHDMQPDVAVIPECSQEDASRALAESGYTSLWFGSNPAKGLAIFAASAWTLELAAKPDNTWIVPIHVRGPESFLLIAVWAWHDTNKSYAGYVQQLEQAFERNPSWFSSHEPLVIAGDFNSNSQFDKHLSGTTHSQLVSFLTDHQVVSAYHTHTGEPQGQEKLSTFHLYRHVDKPHHIDYIFIPDAWKSRLSDVTIGSKSDWLKHSDHLPMMAHLAAQTGAT
jgi:exonuclease III